MTPDINKENNKSTLWTGAMIGFIFSIIASLITIWVQHSFSKKERELQLFLDEKKGFVIACEEYLKQYREWHELMNYYVYTDEKTSEFNSKSAEQAYKKWKKNIDIAYGKVFLVSDNDFGFLTLQVSTALHNSIVDIIDGKHSVSEKEEVLHAIDEYFFENWMMHAQEEIFRYNTGERMQKSTQQYIEEQAALRRQELEYDSISDNMYQSLQNAEKFMRKRDSLAGRYDSSWRMPSREEFNEFIKQK